VEPRSDAFIRDYLTAREADLVMSHPAGAERHVAANLAWSAKESALKVLRTGLRRDTRSVEIAYGTGKCRGWTELAATVDGRQISPGWWQRLGDFVLTVAAETEPFPAPAALVEPPGLAGGVPSHHWMRRPLV
jgi:4'-phosphopantetheinyl transferase